MAGREIAQKDHFCKGEDGECGGIVGGSCISSFNIIKKKNQEPRRQDPKNEYKRKPRIKERIQRIKNKIKYNKSQGV